MRSHLSPWRSSSPSWVSGRRPAWADSSGSGANMALIIDPRPDTIASGLLADGRVVDVIPLTYGRARLVVSRDAQVNWYEDGW